MVGMIEESFDDHLHWRVEMFRKQLDEGLAGDNVGRVASRR